MCPNKKRGGDYYLELKSALRDLVQIRPSPIIDRRWVVHGSIQLLRPNNSESILSFTCSLTTHIVWHFFY